MTRENKLALIVGFGLVLFVGILISDHFASDQRAAHADLNGRDDPLAQQRFADEDLIDTQPGVSLSSHRSNPQPAMRPATLERYDARRDVDPQPLNDGDVINMPDLQNPPPPRETIWLLHEVKKGESLAAISTQYYQTPDLAEAIAEYNGIKDPNLIRRGHNLRIPKDRQYLLRSAGISESDITMPPASAAPPKTYTVQPGETLSEIAQKLLGSAGQWRTLYKHNANVIDDPDNVQVGTVLRLPGGEG